jgi:hypothetical protein
METAMMVCGVLKMILAVTVFASIQSGIVRVQETSVMTVSAMKAQTAV